MASPYFRYAITPPTLPPPTGMPPFQPSHNPFASCLLCFVFLFLCILLYK